MLDNKQTHGRYWLSRASLLSVLSIVVVALLVAHTEVIISRAYAPETVLMRLPSSVSGGDCAAVISTNTGIEHEEPLRKLDSVYQYLDSSVFTVTPETGYSLLETGLQNYTKDYLIVIKCQTRGGDADIVREFSSNDPHSCFVQQKGRFLVC